MSHKISLRLIGNMEYKHRVFVCVISYSIQQFHLIKHSSPLAMDSWTPPRPDGSPSDHPLWLSPDHKLIKIKFSNWLLKLE